MMRTVVLVLLIFVGSDCISQKNDYKWLFGYENAYAQSDSNFGGVTLDFDSTPVSISKRIRIADFDECSLSYCDNNGELRFYSNCADLFDARDSVMQNGDSINYNNYWELFNGQGNYRYSGLRIAQGMLALPSPRDSNSVYLLHYPLSLFQFPVIAGYLADKSYYSIVFLPANNGNGVVLRKDQLLTNDTLSFSNLSAVRHGNGRDWWIIHPRYKGNCYYTFLLSDTGIGISQVQCIGDDQLYYSSLGTSCFSPNGEKYFWVNAGDGIRMFDFDRCTGILSNPQRIAFPFPSFADSVGLIAGIAVSPNNRFLYVAGATILLQYDLLANNISISVDTVGLWDGTYQPHQPFATNFFLAQLGPDGKIYINSANTTLSLHVINDPNFSGESCNFVQHSLALHTYNGYSLPNYPNYRLGPLTNSNCDTLTSLKDEVRSEKEKILKVYPNPTNNFIVVDYGFTDWNKGEISLEIQNELGQTVYTQKLPMYSGYQKLDVSFFAAGFYIANIKRQNTLVATAKFVKQ